jgi:gliding motility-associated protein GldM
MGQFSFRVRRLPDPTPYINIKDEGGNPNRFKGGAMTKSSLMDIDGIGAAIDDGILDITFKVVSFETVFYDNMGNAVPMAGDADRFSARQKETFRKLARGRRFYISNVKAIGPDGIERTLKTSMEIKVN